MRLALLACIALSVLFLLLFGGYALAFAFSSLAVYGYAAAVSGIAVIAFVLIGYLALRWLP